MTLVHQQCWRTGRQYTGIASALDAETYWIFANWSYFALKYFTELYGTAQPTTDTINVETTSAATDTDKHAVTDAVISSTHVGNFKLRDVYENNDQLLVDPYLYISPTLMHMNGLLLEKWIAL